MNADTLRAIDSETDYHQVRWGTNHDSTKSVGDFLLYIEDYVSKTRRMITTDAPISEIMEEFRKITALGVAAMNRHGAIPRKGY
jgi:hypothetical protein